MLKTSIERQNYFMSSEISNIKEYSTDGKVTTLLPKKILTINWENYWKKICRL